MSIIHSPSLNQGSEEEAALQRAELAAKACAPGNTAEVWPHIVQFEERLREGFLPPEYVTKVQRICETADANLAELPQGGIRAHLQYILSQVKAA